MRIFKTSSQGWGTDRRIALLSGLSFLLLGGLGLRLVQLPEWSLWLLPLFSVPLLLVLCVANPLRTLGPRLGVMVSLTMVVFGMAFGFKMLDRVHTATAPDRFIHDGAVQTEDAARFFVAGQNPYSADYRSAQLGKFYDSFSGGQRPNPPWFHYVYLPFTFLLTIPFDIVFRSLTGWYDQRLLYILAQGLSLFFLLKLTPRTEWKIFVSVLFLWNPFWDKFFTDGYNDILVFSLVLGSLWALRQKRALLSGILFGLGVATKQTAWLFIPFYLGLLFWRGGLERKRAWQAVGIAVGVASVLVLPFFLANPQAFLDDVYRYPSGTLTTSYPITGFGLSKEILLWGFVSSQWDYFPFWIIQLVVGAPLLLVLLLRQRSQNTLGQAILSVIVFLFVFWYCSRFFNSNYFSFLSMLGIVAIGVAGAPAWIRSDSPHD